VAKVSSFAGQKKFSLAIRVQLQQTKRFRLYFYEAPLIAPYVPGMFTFLSIVTEDEYKSDTLVRSLVGLIGDLADTLYGTDGKQFFQVDWITQTLREARSSRHYSQSTKEVARWAKEMVKRTLQS
jgi:importin subunit beta-1